MFDTLSESLCTQLTLYGGLGESVRGSTTTSRNNACLRQSRKLYDTHIHDFSLRRRSPLLAITSGLVTGLFSCAVMYDLILGERPTLQGSSTFFILVGMPIYVPVTMGAYFMRAVRLLVMYNPRLRRRWGRILKEKAILRVLLVPPLLMQVVIWSTVPVYGTERWVTPSLQRSELAARPFDSGAQRGQLLLSVP